MKYKVWDNKNKAFTEDIIVRQDGSLSFFIKRFDGLNVNLKVEESSRYWVEWFGSEEEKKDIQGEDCYEKQCD